MLHGNIDICQERAIEGWAWDPISVDCPILLASYADGKLVSLDLSAGYRADLASAGIGNGMHAFRIAIPETIWNGGAPIHVVSILPGSPVPGSPVVVGPDGRRVPSPVDTSVSLDIEALKASWNSHSDVKALESLLSKCDQRNVALRQHIYESFIEGQILLSQRNNIELLRNKNFMRPGLFLGDILLFAPVNWSYRIQRYQHFAMRLADLGFRIFYISPDSINRGRKALRYVITDSPHPDVYVTQFAAMEEITDLASGRLDESVIESTVHSISSMVASLRLAPPICISAFPTWHPIIDRLSKMLYVYDCADYHAGFDHVAGAVSEMELSVLGAADVVTVSAGGLRDLFKERVNNGAIHLVPNATDSSILTAQISSADKNRPVIGYIGAIEKWLDTDIYCEAAMLLPGCDFVVAGSGSVEVQQRLARIPNVTLVGEISYAEVPKLLSLFDVGVIPFKQSALTKYTDPIKVYEYLAAGLPVVATEMPELEKFSNFIEFGATGAAFAEAIVRALSRSSPADQGRRRLLAAQHTWERRSVDLATLIRQRLPHMILVIVADDCRIMRYAARLASGINVTVALVVRAQSGDATQRDPLWRAPSGHILVLHARAYGEVIAALESRSNSGEAVVALCDARSIDQNLDAVVVTLLERAHGLNARMSGAEMISLESGSVGLSSWAKFRELDKSPDNMAATPFSSFARLLIESGDVSGQT